MSEYQVGDRVDSIYGQEHRGVVIAAGPLGVDTYLIRRDSDGFEWFGMDRTMVLVEEYDPTPCCPDPGCSGSPCTFPGYADNH